MSPERRVAVWINSSLAIQKLNREVGLGNFAWPDEVSELQREGAYSNGDEQWEFTMTVMGKQVKVRVEGANP
jgi:hypothetical protein